MTFGFLSDFAKPVLWACGLLSTMMFLNVYDAESFLLSFVILATGMTGTVLLWPKSGPLTFPRSPFLLFLFAFWGLAFVSVVFSEITYSSFIFFCFLSTLPLAFFFCVSGENKDEFFSRIYVTAMVIYAALSIMTLLQYFYTQDVLAWGLTAWPFANPNSLAGFLSLGFFCAYGGAVYAPTPRKKLLLFALSLLIISAMYTTGGRGALLSLIISFAIMVWLLSAYMRRDLKTHLSFLGLAVAAFFALIFFAPDNAQQPPQMMFRDSFAGEVPLLYNRLDVWASTWEIIKDHFWLGTGVGTFFQYYPEYRGGDTGTSGHMAHNDTLQFWSEMGVLAPIMFLSLIVAAILKTARAMKILPADDKTRIQIATPFCALGAMVLHTQIDFHFYVLPILFAAGSLLSFWYVKTEQVLPSKTWAVTTGLPFENVLVKSCVAVLILCCTTMFICFQSSEIIADRAKAKMFAGDVEGFVSGINLAGELSFNRNARALAMASTVPSGVMKVQGKTMPIPQQIELYKKADTLLDRAIYYNPRLASAYHEKALLVEHALKYFPQEYKKMAGENPPGALELVRTSLRLDPLHAGTRAKLAGMLMKVGREDEAYEVLKAGLKWPYYSSKALTYFEMLATMALKNGDAPVRDRALQRIAALNHNIEKQKHKNEYKRTHFYLQYLYGN